MPCTISGIEYYVDECFTLDYLEDSYDRECYPDFFKWFDKQSDSVKDAVLKILKGEAKKEMDESYPSYDECDDDALDLGFAINLTIRNHQFSLGALGEETNKGLCCPGEREWGDADWNEWLFVLSNGRYGSKSMRRNEADGDEVEIPAWAQWCLEHGFSPRHEDGYGVVMGTEEDIRDCNGFNADMDIRMLEESGKIKATCVYHDHPVPLKNLFAYGEGGTPQDAIRDTLRNISNRHMVLAIKERLGI